LLFVLGSLLDLLSCSFSSCILAVALLLSFDL
jgi:hypothetical protein